MTTTHKQDAKEITTMGVVELSTGEQVLFPLALVEREQELFTILQGSAKAMIAFYIRLEETCLCMEWQNVVDSEGRPVFATETAYLEDLARRLDLSIYTIRHYKSAIRTLLTLFTPTQILEKLPSVATARAIAEAYVRDRNTGEVLAAKDGFDVPPARRPSMSLRICVEHTLRPQPISRVKVAYHVDAQGLLNFIYVVDNREHSFDTTVPTEEVITHLARKGIHPARE